MFIFHQLVYYNQFLIAFHLIIILAFLWILVIDLNPNDIMVI